MKPRKIEQRLAEFNEWAGIVNHRLAALESTRPVYADGAPPGVVSPHAKQNLEALAEWCTTRWYTSYGPQAEARDEAIEFALTQLYGKIMVALAGGDVDRPLDVDRVEPRHVPPPTHRPPPVRPIT